MFVTPGSRANRKRSPSITGGSLLPIVGNGLTVTTSTPLLDLSQTWNNAAAAFTGWLLNITNTASAAGSVLFDFQVGGSSLLSLKPNHALTWANGSGTELKLDFGFNTYQIGVQPFSLNIGVNNNFNINSVGYGGTPIARITNNGTAAGGVYGIQFGSGLDTNLWRDAAGIFAIHNGVNAQSFRVYNTRTDAANFERGIFDWTTTANTLTIGTQAGGTGTLRDLATVGSRWYFTGGAGVVLIGAFSNVVSFYGGWPIGWGAGAASNSIDTGLGRNAAGVVEINTGSLGTFGDLKARNYTGTGGTVTASTPVLDLSQTWNAGAVTFTALKLNVTNTASAAASMLLDLQVGSSSKFNIDVSGGKLTTSATGFIFNDGSNVFYASDNRGGNAGASLAANASWSWCSATNDATGTTVDTGLARQVAGVVGLVNLTTLTNACGFQVYNTADSRITPTNFERGVFDWTTTANTLTIGTQAGGTGTGRSMHILSGSVSNNYLGVTGGTKNIAWSSTGFNFVNLTGSTATGVFWTTSTTDAWTNTDLGLCRRAALVLAISDGTSGVNSNGWMQWGGQARVTANFTSSNATLTAITGISSVALQAGRNYSFRAWLAVTGSSLAGVQVGITCSSTTITTLLSDGYMHDAGVMRGSSVGVINSTGTPVVAVSSATVTSSNPSIRVDGMIRVASSGLFGLTLAQSTASATQTIVSSASYMIVYDMP